MINPYNPKYDPLYDKTPGCNVDYSPSYWVAAAGKQPQNDGIANKNYDTEVAIIGGGFTGLATAMFLAREYNIKATVLEANMVGWGCTSRNGGQGHLAWGRLNRGQWISRWGKKMALKIHKDTLKGFAIFAELTKKIDCDASGNGSLLIAHSRSSYENLVKQSKLCNEFFNYPTKILDTKTIHNEYIKDDEAYGGILEPVGIAVNPLKLAFGYLKIAREYGAKVHIGSPVISWNYNKGKHELNTPQATIRADKVIVATAGYTNHSLHKLLAYKNMPIMANCAVTRVLTDKEISACNFKSHIFFTDSRKLRYYYRFLKEKRLQIGTRSAISGSDADNPKHLLVVQKAIARKFPAIAGVKIEYFCSGWMDISHDMMPRISQPDPKQQIYYSQGYSGNGVAFSAYAAKMLAKLVADKKYEKSDLPVFTSQLPSHPLRPFRRFGQRLLYGYFNVIDKLP